MRYGKLLACVAALLAVVACDDTGVNPAAPIPEAATVRVINTGTDQGTVDLRFVDRVENLPTLLGVPFRGYSGMYQRTQPGTRPTRVFPYHTHPDTTQIRLVDTSINLAANTRYSLVYAGRTSADAPEAERQRLAVIQDPPAPTPPAEQIAIKALHAAVGTGPVDVYVVPVDTTTAPTPADFDTNNSGVLRNVSYLTQSDYINVAVRPRTPRLPLYRFIVTAAGSTTPLFAATPNLPGTPAPAPGAVGHGTVGPQPGVQIAGSALTVVVAPGSTPGTRGSTTANQSPTTFLVVDRVLNP